MARLPQPGADDDVWGDILNEYLSVSHNADGTVKNGAIGDSQITDVNQSKVIGLNASLSTKEPFISAGTSGQYYRGDKTWQTLDRTALGLGNVDNTSDASKPISSATQSALDAKVTANGAITGATKTKVTYDAKGLVTGGADATTADIADSTDKRYVTDSQLTVLGNTSGTNTGDQDLSGLQPLDSDLTAIAGLTASNDDVLQRKAGAWTSRTPAQLKTDLAVTKTDVGLGNVDNTSDTNKPISTATADAIRTIQLKIIDDTTTLTTGDSKLIFCIPSNFNGLNLIDADAYITTVSSSGTPTIQLRNITNANSDMLSTAITIDVSENTSYTAAIPPVINLSTDNIATGDLLSVDVDVSGTGAKGLGIILRFG